MVKPEAMSQLGDVLSEVQRNGFRITNLRMTKLSRQDVAQLYSSQQHEHFFK